jgi:8-oxo-dGTP pyrophosphatase MutT (NUDIX family)
MNSKKKVIAYFIRSKNHQKEVLVFDHEGMPEAGTQVVGGTLEDGEELKAALVREIKEESGLIIDVTELRFLAETIYKRKDKPEINYRTYFVIEGNELHESWSHQVVSDGEDNGLVFNFYWLSLAEAERKLTGNFSECLSLLRS